MGDGDKPYDPRSAMSDAIVKALGPELAKHPRGAKAVSGWLDVTSTDRWRLYLTIEFDEWIEFPIECVIYHQSLVTGSDPLAPTLVWLDADCNVSHAQPDDSESQAQFLTGNVVNELPDYIRDLISKFDPFNVDKRRCRHGHRSISGAGCSTVPVCYH